MEKTRRALVGAWALLGGLTLVGDVTAQTPSGLLSSSVCVSALTFGVILLTPTATLSEAATAAVKSRFKD